MKITTVLSIQNLTKIYGRELKIGSRKLGRRVIGAKNVSFNVVKGEIFGFLGPNGAGKTTTMRAVLNYLNIQRGSITVFGQSHDDEAIAIRERIGYVPGDLTLYDDFTGIELLDYYSKYRPMDHDFLEELKATFRVDLTLKIGSLSSGNRQQVGLIAALAAKPEFLILDEPISGLDPLMAANFHKLLRNLSQNEGITVFLSSHDLAEVQAVCDRVGIIKEGKMILVENVESLREKFLQNVRVTFQDITNMPTEQDFSVIPTVIDVKQSKKRTFTLRIREDVDSLLKFLAKYHVLRLAIEDATLEEIFLQYYK
jgi:ABC-2 type transport system ATP-binding protein